MHCLNIFFFLFEEKEKFVKLFCSHEMVQFQFSVVLGKHCLVITLIFSMGREVELGGIQISCFVKAGVSLFLLFICLFNLLSIPYQNETKLCFDDQRRRVKHFECLIMYIL